MDPFFAVVVPDGQGVQKVVPFVIPALYWSSEHLSQYGPNIPAGHPASMIQASFAKEPVVVSPMVGNMCPPNNNTRGANVSVVVVLASNVNEAIT